MLEECEWNHGSQKKGIDPTWMDADLEVSELFPVVGMAKMSHMGK